MLAACAAAALAVAAAAGCAAELLDAAPRTPLCIATDHDAGAETENIKQHMQNRKMSVSRSFKRRGSNLMGLGGGNSGGSDRAVHPDSPPAGGGALSGAAGDGAPS